MNPIWSLTDWRFWLAAIEFVIVTWLFWYLPGRLLLRKIDQKLLLAAPVRNALSVVVGLVVWTTIAYAFGWLGLRWLVLIPSGILAGIELGKYQSWKELWALLKWRKWRVSLLGLILLAGLLIQLPAIFGSGLRTSQGVKVYFTNSEDGMMHLAYIQNLTQHFPPQRPEAAGLMLTNYHYWGDLTTAELNRFFGLPITHLFFQYLPVLLSLLAGCLVFGLIQAWGGSKRTGYLGLFFWYLGGDFDYGIAWLLHRDWYWHAAAIDNGADQFLNQPQTFAKVIFLAGLWLLNYYWQHRKTWAWWLTLLLFGSLIGFKVYFGLFAIGALGLATLWRTVKKQSNWGEWMGLMFMGLFSAAIYLPSNHGAGGLIFIPLGWPKLLLSMNHLDWNDWWLRQQTYEANQNWRNVGILNGLAVVITLVAMYGTRLVGWLGLVKNLPKNQPSTWAWFWWPMSVLFVFLGFNTMQNPGGFNTFNFIVVVSVPLVLSSAFVIESWWNQKGWRNWVGKILVIILLILTVPRSLHNSVAFLRATLRQEAPLTLSSAELQVMDWLAYNTSVTAVLQTHPESAKARQSTFLAYLSNRSTYVTSTNILETHGLALTDRKDILNLAIRAGNYAGLVTILKPTNISYLYIENIKGQRELLSQPDMSNHVVFQNEAGWVISLLE